MPALRSKLKKKKTPPSAISLFTCGMGMDLGFEKAGFQIKYTNDIADFACNTIRKMRPEIPCDEGDITKITTKQILRKAGLKKSKADVIIGGPPCQSFSTAGMRRGFNDERGIALKEFIRVVREARPKFFVFENVAGLKSMPLKHIPFYDRIKKDKKKLSKEQRQGSLFEMVLKKFGRIRGYDIEWKIINAADFGVPQKRKRLFLIGSRTDDPKLIFDEIQKQAKWADPRKANEDGKKAWRTLEYAIQGIKDAHREYTQFPIWGKYLEYVPPGGCWVDLPKKYKRKAMGGAANTRDPRRKGKQGGRTGFYRRLSWDAPSPTLVTSPSQLATCLCHPEEDRPLTVLEYARIQGFSSNWNFVGSIPQKYRMIGEAVPVKLAQVIAKTIYSHL